MKLKVKCTSCGKKFDAILLDGEKIEDFICTNCNNNTLEKDEE